MKNKMITKNQFLLKVIADVARETNLTKDDKTDHMLVTYTLVRLCANSYYDFIFCGHDNYNSTNLARNSYFMALEHVGEAGGFQCVNEVERACEKHIPDSSFWAGAIGLPTGKPQ